ncbi:MAG: hypothetical protein ACRDTE_06360 [Pseudonocardiaceae bacterium]
MTSDVTEWLALLRAHEGGLTRLNNGYLNHGRPVAGYLADALTRLIDTDHLDSDSRARADSDRSG